MTTPAILTLTGTISASGNTDVPITGAEGVSLDKICHFYSARALDAGWGTSDLQPMVTTEIIDDAGTLKLRVAKPTAEAETYAATFWVFPADSAVVVQHASIAIEAGEDFHVGSITAVSSTAQAFWIPHGVLAASDNDHAPRSVQLSFASTSSVRAQHGAGEDYGSDVTVFFEVVDWGSADIRVQHKTATITASTSADSTSLSPAVDLSRTFLVSSYRTTATGLSAEQFPTVYLLDTDTVRAETVVSGTTQVNTQVIEDVASTPQWTVEALHFEIAGGVSLGEVTGASAQRSTTTRSAGLDLRASLVTFDAAGTIVPNIQLGAYPIGLCSDESSGPAAVDCALLALSIEEVVEPEPEGTGPGLMRCWQRLLPPRWREP